MGCDIHLFVETRDNEDSPWRALGKWGPSRYPDDEVESYEWFQQNRARHEQWYAEGRSPHPNIVEAAERPGTPRYNGGPVEYNGRNYTVFAALAGVRNDNGIIPIHENRGMPDDVTTNVHHEWARWGPDAHSASHSTLTELALWEGWRQTFETEMWVTRGGYPNETPLGDEDMARLADVSTSLGRLPHLTPDAWNLSTCSWSSSPEKWRTLRFTARLDKNLGSEWLQFMCDLHRVGMQVGSDNVRVVYWFDN